MAVDIVFTVQVQVVGRQTGLIGKQNRTLESDRVTPFRSGRTTVEGPTAEPAQHVCHVHYYFIGQYISLTFCRDNDRCSISITIRQQDIDRTNSTVLSIVPVQ